MQSSLLVRLYEKATGTSARPRSAAAVARFGPYLAGMLAAKLLSTVGQLLVSRQLGPDELGRLAVVLSASALLALPVANAFGTAFVRYAAAQPEHVWAPLLRWTSRRIAAIVGALAVAVAALSPLLAHALGVPAALLVAGAGLAVAMALWLLAKAACQGREDWQRFVGSEIGFGSVTFLLPCAMYLLGWRDWWIAALAFALAYVVGAGAARKYFTGARATVGPGGAHTDAAGYARFALFTGAANSLFFHSDRFVAQHVVGFAELGVYQVYSLATIGVAALGATLLYNFVFPLFPQGDRRAFGSLFLAGFARLSPLVLIALFAGGWVQIHLTGFPFRPILLACATASAAAFILSNFFGQLVLSIGVSGSRLCARVAVVSLVLFAAGVVPALRLGGLAGLFLLYAALYAAVAAFYALALRRLPAEETNPATAG